MIANIVFGVVLLAYHLLVEIQAMMSPSVQVPSGTISFAQAIRDASSWSKSPQNALLGPSNSRDRRPLQAPHRRLVEAIQSSGNNDQTRLNSSNDDRSYHSVSGGSSETPTAIGMMKSIWELKNGTAIPSQIDDYQKFESHSCYLTYLEDAATAATIAILNKYNDGNASIKLCREAEGQESPAFKSFFEEKPATFSRDLSTNVNEKKMFVIERMKTNDPNQEEVLELKEVELPIAKVLQDERGCYVFVLEKVYLCCGIKASVRGKLGGAELARIMMKRKGLKDEEVITYRTDRLFSKKTPEAENVFNFLKDFETLSQTKVIKNIDGDPGEFTQKELRAILDHTAVRVNGEEWFMLKVTRIFNSPETDEVQEELIIPLHEFVPLILEYHSKNCLLVDSRSNCGLFLWIGVDTAVEFVAECARRAELYLRRKEYNFANRITFVHQEDLPPDVDSAQKMVEFVVALNENGRDHQSSDSSSAVEDSLKD